MILASSEFVHTCHVPTSSSTTAYDSTARAAISSPPRYFPGLAEWLGDALCAARLGRLDGQPQAAVAGGQVGAAEAHVRVRALWNKKGTVSGWRTYCAERLCLTCLQGQNRYRSMHAFQQSILLNLFWPRKLTETKSEPYSDTVVF